MRVQFAEQLAQARRATNEGRTIEAIESLQEARKVDANDPTLLLLSARVARMTRSYAEAAAVIDRYWQRYGETEELTLERLLLRAASENPDAVMALLGPRIATGGEVAEQCRHAIVNGLLRDFRYDTAQAVIDEWRRENPESVLSLDLQGRLHEQLLQFSQAAAAYQALVERHPDHLDARIRLVRMLMEQRKATDALPHIELLRQSLPAHPEVLLQRAVALRQVGRTEDAGVALEEALQYSPNTPEVLTERAAVALNAGDDERAVEILERAIAIEPGAVGARNLLAQAYTRLGRTADAEAQEEQVEKLTVDSERLTELIHGPLHTRPNDPGPPFEIAGIALRSGQVGEAIRWYELALQRDPAHSASHTALAVIYHELGKPVLATKHRALAAGGKP